MLYSLFIFYEVGKKKIIKCPNNFNRNVDMLAIVYYNSD